MQQDKGGVGYTDEQYIAGANDSMPPGLTLLKARVVDASQERGELTMCFELDDRFGNSVGAVSGGYITQMLDQSATFAATLVTGRAAPSVALTVSFLESARPGRFEAVGTVVRAGRSMAFLEAELRDADGRLVAKGTVNSLLGHPIAEAIRKAAAPGTSTTAPARSHNPHRVR